MERKQWNALKKGIAQHGIDFRIHDACCVGCADLPSDWDENAPAIYTIKKAFKPLSGGWLYHSNIADTDATNKLVDLFHELDIDYRWDQTDNTAIRIQA
jgi:hypothetical protein